MPMTVSELQVKVSADTKEAESGLAALGSKIGGIGSTIGTAFGAAALGGIAALGAGLTASVAAASTFEAAMSGIKAVSGATAAEMESLTAAALDLGAKTSFSATEAADGIGELVKAGVSIQDVLGGGAAAALNLAAAGGIEVAEAAEIASNAMNVFSLSGADVGHVADVIAGAANASAIDVHDFGMSLSAVGAVAATVGIGFDDLGTAVAVMGQAGIKGSDAGTSLKTMLLNLSPATDKAAGVMKQLGIITADGSNQFFDATGKAKSLSEVAGVLATATSGLTEQQKLQALQTMFGTDAIRAAAIMAKAGAAGFDEMATSIGKVTAADVAKTRLDNLKGSIEQLKGSLETAGIHIGTLLIPGIRSMVDGLTEGINSGIDIIKKLPSAWDSAVAAFNGTANTADLSVISEVLDKVFGRAVTDLIVGNIGRMGDAWRTMKQAFAGNWSPSAEIDPFVNSVGNAATALAKLRDFIGEVAQKARDMGTLDTMSGAVTHIGEAAGTAWQNGEKLAASIGRIGGAAGSKVSAFALAFALAVRTIATAFDLAVLNAGFLVNTALTLGRVFADSAATIVAAGKSLAAWATGDVKLGQEAAREFIEAVVDMKDAGVDWKNNSGATFSAGMADIKNLVGSGSQAAAAEHKRAVDSMVTAQEASMGSMSVATQAGMGDVVAAVESNAPAASGAVETMASSMTGALEAASPQMVAAADTAATGVVPAVEGQAPAAAAAATTMGTGMAAGIETAAPQMAAAAEQGASGAVAAVEGQQGAASSAGQGVGDSLGSGMQSGIMGRVGRIASAAANLVSSAIGAARQEADAHSPSKKTEKLGKDLADGLEVGLSKSNLGADMQAKIRDFIEASRAYIPVAGQIKRVEDEIATIREKSQTDALFRAEKMITIDSEVLRLKQAQVSLERDLLPLRQDLARATREVTDIERGSLTDRTRLIEMDGERKTLRLQEIELEKQLIGLDSGSKKAKSIQEQIDKLKDTARALDLEAEKTRLTSDVAATAARVKKETLDDQARGQQTVIDLIKDQIDTLGAEQGVFTANENVIKNATQNEIDYRNRLIAVFKSEATPLTDRVAAGLKLVDQLEKEGKISKELADKLRDVAKEAGSGSEKTAALGNAAATATPQMDAAAKKADEMAKAAQKIADETKDAGKQVDALSSSLGKLPDWFKPKSSSSGSLFDPKIFKAAGGPVAAGQSYIVGERGPELFMPRQSGTILPHVPTMQGGGGTQTHRFVIAGPDGRTLAEWHVRGRDMAVDLGLLPRGTS